MSFTLGGPSRAGVAPAPANFLLPKPKRQFTESRMAAPRAAWGPSVVAVALWSVLVHHTPTVHRYEANRDLGLAAGERPPISGRGSHKRQVT